MKQSRSSWYIHVSFIVAAAVLSFVLHQAPYVFSSRPYSIGADGDSAFHFAIQMKLRDPTLFPKDIELNEMVLSSRPTFEFAIHRVVVWLADHLFKGNLFVANVAIYWCYHLLFLVGCYLLGLFVLRLPGGAALFTAALVGLSKAFSAWWGMAYGAVIPKYIGLTLIPWFILGYLRWAQYPWRLVILFFALGLFVNVYPLLPLYLALILLAVTFSRSKQPWSLGIGMGIAFSVAGLPSVLTFAMDTFAKRGTLSGQEQVILEVLLMRHYGYALLDLKYTAGSLISPVWFTLIVAGVGWLLQQRGADLDEVESRFFGHLSVGVVILGFVGIAANLAGRIRYGLAHILLVCLWVGFFLLRAARAGLFSKWFRIKSSGVEGLFLLFTVWTMALSLAGLVVGVIYRPLVTLLLYRASVFLYVPAYMGSVWLAMYWIRQRTAAGRVLGVGIALVILLSGAVNTALVYRLRGARVAQISEPYYALADWAAQNTPVYSLFMTPYGLRTDTFFAFRVYAMRGVLLNWVAGEMVISNPRLATRFWEMSNDIGPLYAQASGTADFVRVARKYRVDYIVTDPATLRTPDLPIAYQNEVYTVFTVPPE